MNTTPRLRILQVVYIMQRGGVETLLVNILRHLDGGSFRMDVAVRTEAEGDYDAELRAAGVEILRCASVGSPLKFAWKLFRVLRTKGPYDIVHSHMHTLDGLVMLVAALAGTGMRISHSHNTRDGYSDRRRWRVFRSGMRLLTRLFATHKLAVSETAYRAQFGYAPGSAREILLNGVDLRALQVPSKECSTRLRRELGLPPDSKLVGHVGRFHRQKNHRFLLEAFARLQADEPGTHLVLAGAGPLERELRALSSSLALENRVHFLGSRSDVASILRALDLFVLPSLYEGFGIAVVEAQACGVPCLVSEAIPPEADAGLDLVTTLPLGAGAAAWAHAMKYLLSRSVLLAPEQCIASVRQAGLDIAGVARRWESLYLSGTNPKRNLTEAGLSAALD